MRYFLRDGWYIPKHNLYGPRPNEGAVFDEAEWSRVYDHFFRDQRVQEAAQEKVAADEEQKMTSWKMTSTWKNTFTSVQLNREKNRVENIERVAQKKLDQYNEVMKVRAERRAAILDEAKRVIESQKDSSKRLINSLKLAAVIRERQNQIAFDKMVKAREDKREAIYAEKIRKDVEEFKAQACSDAPLRKKLKYKTALLEQIKEKQEREKADAAAELAKEKEDLARMAIEIKRINDLEKADKAKEKTRVRNAAVDAWKLAGKINKRKEVMLQQEDLINTIYRLAADDIAKQRKLQDAEDIQKALRCREKQTEKIAEVLSGAARLETEAASFQKAEKEMLEREMRELKEKEAKKTRLLAELVEAEKEAKAKELAEKTKRRESMKWEIMQRHKREEVNKAWRESLKLQGCKKKREFRAILDRQVKQREEKLAQEREEEATFLRVSYEAENKALLKFCDWTLNYCKEKDLPAYPVKKAIQAVKKANFLCEPKEAEPSKPEVPTDTVDTNCKKEQLVPKFCVEE